MDLQQLLVLGRATKDAEVLESKEGKKYARFSIAVNDYLGKEKETRTAFYNVLVFNKTADKTEKIKKGTLLMVNGRPDVNAYLSNEGEAKASLVVYANKWRILK